MVLMRGLIILLLLIGPAFGQSWPSAPVKQENQTQSEQQKAASDQRGTKQNPIFVQTLRSDETADETARKDREAKEKNDAGRWAWRFGILTIVALFGQLAVFIAQAYFLWGTLEATSIAAKAADKAIDLIHRPWVSFVEPIKVVGPLRIDRTSARITIRNVIKNAGPAIATSVSTHLAIKIGMPSDAELDALLRPYIDNTVRQQIGTRGAVLLPGQEFESPNTECGVGRHQFRFNPDGSISVCVWGAILYRDEFGREHHTTFLQLFRDSTERNAFNEAPTIDGKFIFTGMGGSAT